MVDGKMLRGENNQRRGTLCAGNCNFRKQSRPDDSFHPLVLLKTWNVQGSPSKPDMS